MARLFPSENCLPKSVLGMILAALPFISRVASTTTVSQVTHDYVKDGRLHDRQDLDRPENGHKPAPLVILRLRNLNALDATGLFALELEEGARQLHASKRTLIFCGGTSSRRS